MHVLAKACVSAMTLAMAAAFTMGAAQAIQPIGAPQLSGSFVFAAETAKESTPAAAAAEKPAPAAKAKAKPKAEAASKAAKKVAKAKPTGAKPTGAKTTGAKPGGCGVGRYYDIKTNGCADAALKKV